MNKEEDKVNFDLSTLTLQQLIETYQNITDFLRFLKEKEIVEEEKDKNE